MNENDDLPLSRFTDLSDKELEKDKSKEKNIGGKRGKIFYIFLFGISFIVLSIIILILIICFGLNKEYNPIPEKEDLNFTEKEHREFSRYAATQGMILVKNDGGLPLKKSDQVVLFGKGANNTIYGGWGSGEVYEKGTSTNIIPIQILKGIENKVIEKKILYVNNTKGFELNITGSNLTEKDIENYSKHIKGAERSVAIFVISRRSGEALDRTIDDSDSGVFLNAYEKATYKAIEKYFDNVVVIVNTGSVMDLDEIPYNKKTSILISYYPGMEAGNAISDILVGDMYPSGHLTDTWAKIEDYPTTSTFIESLQYVKYKEGIYVGYRYFEEDEDKQKKVIFPFGYGLSYTKFEMKGECNFIEKDKQFNVKVNIKNSGSFSGRETVMVFVEKSNNKLLIKSKRELVAFQKTKELKPGDSQELNIKFNMSLLGSYDENGVNGYKSCIILEEGLYNIYIGNSVADTRGLTNKIFTYENKDIKLFERLENRIPPQDEDIKKYINIKPNFNELTNINKENIKKYNEIVHKINDLYNNNKNNSNEHLNSNSDDEEYNLPPSNITSNVTFKSVLLKKHKMSQLVSQLTNEELAYLSFGHKEHIKSGTGTFGGHLNSGSLSKFLIPFGETLDGPAGLRQSEKILGSTAWPCSTLVASSFDVDLIEKIGEKVGKEARRINCSFWLAPGMNIHRSPLCGRNFEYYSEDPYVTGIMATHLIKGVQSKRVGAVIKHFAFNNKEINRNGELDVEKRASDSRVSERAAREIYLKGFEIAVKLGDPLAVMSSYNRVNGMKTAESYDLLTGILRNEWGYKGFVMTDWNSNSKHDRETHAGNSLKMPTNSDGIKTILNGLKSGIISRENLEKNILYMLESISKTAAIDVLFKHKVPINITDTVTHIKISENIYQKSPGIHFEQCEDEDKGLNPSNTHGGRWISLFIKSGYAGYRRVKIRYAAYDNGFGVIFKLNSETLGEITNLDKTGGWQKWNTSAESSIYLPEGTFELTLYFVGYSYDTSSNNKGNINWIEIK